MAIYKFRVSFEDYDVHREIEIKSNQTFEDFHNAIHAAINFKPNVSSSFYVSNDQWLKGQEIAFMPSERKIEKGVLLMKDTKISKFIDDPHQKFYYTSNFDYSFDFHIQLIDIRLNSTAAVDAIFPVCVKSMGVDVPVQFKNVASAAKLPPVSVEKTPKSGQAALLAALMSGGTDDEDFDEEELEDDNTDDQNYGLNPEDISRTLSEDGEEDELSNKSYNSRNNDDDDYFSNEDDQDDYSSDYDSDSGMGYDDNY